MSNLQSEKKIPKLHRFLFSPEDISAALKSEKENRIVDALCHFSLTADAEGFQIFRSFLQDKLGEADRKLIFMQKDEKEKYAFLCAAQNKNKPTIEFFFKTLINSVSPLEFSSAWKPEDHLYLLESLFDYSNFAESEAAQSFWPYLEEVRNKET